MEPDKKKIMARLKRIEGQVRGLQRLIENGEPCIDVITQVSAVTSAMKKAGAAIIATHMQECMREHDRDKDKAMKEFQGALSRFIDLS